MVTPNVGDWWESYIIQGLAAIGVNLLEFIPPDIPPEEQAIKFLYSPIWTYLGVMLRAELDGVISTGIPWPQFLEDPAYFSEVEGYLTGIQSFGEVAPALDTWVTYSDPDSKPPHLRITYSEELTNSINLAPLMKDIVEGNAPVLDKFALSRKAGLAGGLLDWHTPIDETQEYFGQPGVNKLNFSDHNGLAYETEEVWPFPPFNNKSLEYELVTFGNTRVGIYGTSDDETALSQTDLYGIDRFDNALEVDAYEAAATNTGLAFQIKTEGIDYGGYEKMLNSNYGQAHENLVNTAGMPPGVIATYNDYFNNGIPTRTWDQNPVDEPIIFWPYVVTLTNDLPSQVAVNISAPSGIQLEIRDASYFDGTGYPNQFMEIEPGSYSVYLDQIGFYSLRVPGRLVVLQDGIYELTGWTGTNVDILEDPQYVGDLSYRVVVFHSPGATVEPVYEAVNQIPNYTFSINNGEIITITAPANINFAEGFSFYIANQGRLEILGTESDPVIFTGAGKDPNWTYDYNNGYFNGDYDPFNVSALITLVGGEAPPPSPNLEFSHAVFRQTGTAVKMDDYGSPGESYYTRALIDNVEIQEVNVGMVLGLTGTVYLEDINISNSNIGFYMLPSYGDYFGERFVIADNDCGFADIPIEGSAGSFHNPDFDLTNCTFYNNADYDVFWRVDGDIDTDFFRTDYSLRNSIFAYSGGFFMSDFVTHSLWYNLTNPPPDNIGVIHNVNPLFVVPGVDFHLQAGSPCIDAGELFTCDPDQTIVDMGAYYFHQDQGGDPCDESAFILKEE